MAKKLRVFISASAPELGVLRRVLAELGVQVSDAFDFDPGEPLAESIGSRIREADFAIVLVEGATPTTWLELGICQGMGKPILVVADSETKLPPVLNNEYQLRTRSLDTDLFRRTVSGLVGDLRAGRKATVRRKVKGGRAAVNRDVVKQILDELASVRQTATGQHVEGIAARLLTAAGLSAVEHEPSAADRGVDFAIWSDDLQTTIGNPLLVEVKAGDLSRGRLLDAKRQVMMQVAKTQAGAGLLLYLDRQGRRFHHADIAAPLVFSFDLEDLANALLTSPFSRVILQTRNQLAHGVGG